MNREEIVRRILFRTRDPVCILSIAFSLNSWVAVNGRPGDIEVPVAVIDRIIDQALREDPVETIHRHLAGMDPLGS